MPGRFASLLLVAFRAQGAKRPRIGLPGERADSVGNMQRWVLHVDMDAFYASCEQLTRPTLRGRPVLVGGVSGRGVVAGASYEARALGARSAMPMFQARPLIGFRGVVVAPRFPVYKAASRRVFRIFEELGGTIEQVSIDECFLEPAELQGADAQEVLKFAEHLRARVREETGLPCSVGAGSGKQTAKIGSGLAKPDGARIIPREKHTEVLHPLDVGTLWGVGPVTAKKLELMGVNTIGDLAAMPRKEVEAGLGATIGGPLWLMANGEDDRPVKPRAIAKQISAEHTYPRDLISVAEVDAAIRRAAEGAHRRLLIDGRGARTVTVKLRMADFHIESRSTTLGFATTDLDVLLAAAFSLARYPAELGPIRLVGVGFSGLEESSQGILFPELEQEKLLKRDFDTDYEVGVRSAEASISEDVELPETASSEQTWRATQDVAHAEFGHGWVQGIGHGKVTVRFETRTSGVGQVRTFDEDDPALTVADPLESLDWADYFESLDSNDSLSDEEER